MKKPTKSGGLTPDRTQRNKIRGVLGAATARSKEPARPRIERYRSGLRQALLDARPALPASYRPGFFEWLNTVVGGNDLARQAISYDLSRYTMEGARINFASEIQWLTFRLKPHLDQLRDFRASVLELNDAFWRDEQQVCFGIIEQIERQCGRSIWQIETRLALEQHFNGLEAQKSYLSDIKLGYPKGLPAFIAHFASIRNEDRSTMRLFKDDADRRISVTDLEDGGKTYFRYKIADSFDGTDVSISRILTTEQGQSIFDVYETAISIFQLIINSGRTERYATAILGATADWQSIGDFRLDKIRVALGEAPLTQLPVRDPAVGTSMFSSVTDMARRQARSRLATDPSDTWAGIEALFGDPPSETDAPEMPSQWRRVMGYLRSVAARDDDFQASVGALEKFARNFRTLPSAAALADFVFALIGSRSNPQIGLGSAALNTPTLGLPDLALSRGPSPAELTSTVGAKSDRNEVAVWTGQEPASAEPEQLAAARYFSAERLSRQGRYPEALLQLTEIDFTTISETLRFLIARLRIELSLQENELDNALGDIATEAAHRPGARALLPADDAVGARGWKELGQLPNKLDLAICLDVLWRNTGDDLRATHLRFAFEDHLANEGVSRPSELSDEPLDREKTIYFLRYICIPSIMDLAGIFNDSDGVIEERTAILQKLRTMDPEHVEEYAEEAALISTRRTIQEGLNIVDSSRVHVDTAAISRWAERRYAESFDRYKALVAAGIGVAEDFDEMLRAALRTAERPTEYFSVPDNEADALLLDVVVNLRSEFLTNQEHGLHFYVGKRIRHGTVTGHLRGSLETSNLITQRITDGGAYRSNLYWLERLTFESDECRLQCDALFRNFAEKYDALVDDLKNNKLHVKSKEKPDGVFTFSVTALSYHVIRSAVQTDLSFTGFLASCYSIFWGLLEPSFSVARSLIGAELKSEAAEMFDALQAGVRNLVVPDHSYHEFSTALRSTSVDVQRQFESMAEWFRRTETEQAAHLFELATLIDIAIESALKTHKGFAPEITRTVTGDVKASSSALVIVSDVVFVIIDNICRRSQSGNSPQVNFACCFDSEEETLTIDVTNAVGSTLDRGHVNVRLDETRAKIASGDIRAGALRDSNSGLLKIAAITGQSAKAGLTFGFEGDSQFRTTVTLSVITGPSNSPALPTAISVAGL